MKDLIRKILKESEGEFEWAQDLGSQPIKVRPEFFVKNDIIKWVPKDGYENYEECHGRIYKIDENVGYGINNPGEMRSYSVTDIRCYPRFITSQVKSWIQGSQWERNHEFYLSHRDNF